MSFGNEREFIDLQQLEERREQAMKCPMRRKIEQSSTGDWGTETLECLKEECAWWGTWTTEKSEEQSGCCLPVLTSIMSEIMGKMPHAGQFTK